MSPSQSFAVRAPTGGAWLMTVVGVIATGELLYERGKSGLAHLFTIPFADSELLMLAAPFALAAVLGVAWLVLLYAQPGRLGIDEASLSRERPRAWRRVMVQAPPVEWRVRVIYFSATDRAHARFKRLELTTRSLREVILFGDLKDGPGLMQAIEAQRERLGAFEIVVEQPDATGT